MTSRDERTTRRIGRFPQLAGSGAKTLARFLQLYAHDVEGRGAHILERMRRTNRQEARAACRARAAIDARAVGQVFNHVRRLLVVDDARVSVGVEPGR
jgi:hypothetical protein